MLKRCSPLIYAVGYACKQNEGRKVKWQKGQSGNPGGRPKEIGHVRELARQHTDDAIQTLAEVMNNAQENSRARVAAAEALLDRGWGRPDSSVNVSSKVDLTHEEILDALMGHSSEQGIAEPQ